MYKVLIADDEVIIRTDLAKAFDWATYDMEIVGLAKNGLEAIAMVESLTPDLCLLDINMPFLNGLELIEKIKAVNPACVNVIVTGYDEFQYAKRAVQLGAYDYVLKPIDEDLFVPMLMSIKLKLDEQVKNRLNEALSDSLLTGNRDLLKNEFLLKWVQGEKTKLEIEQGMIYFGLQFPMNAGLVLIKVNIPVGMIENTVEKALQIDCCKKAVDEYFRHDRSFNLVQLPSDSLLLIVDASDSVLWNSLERTLEQKIGTLMELQIKIDKILIQDGMIGVSDAFSALNARVKTEAVCLPLVKKIKHYVEKNFEDSQLRLQNFADENQVSISYLSKIFKQETGVAFIDYLINYRIMKSLELLERSSLKICTISEMVGYSSQHYYCEAFKKVMGIAPTEYRKRGSIEN